ncbi:MAG TPA: hypothetical protein VFB54_07460 [Burkholderiales bacterium]|nr:hypothetical protein [Burkholderiales bacterium]
MRAARAIVLLASLAVLLPAGLAQPKMSESTRLHLQALLEEGRLLLEEFQALDPVTHAVQEEDERLRQDEQELARESAELARAAAQHNRAANELSRRFREHQKACPKTMTDAAAIDACNARGAELMTEGRALDQTYAELAAKRQELNRRITLHNSSQQSWSKVRREHLPKLATNQADASQWVERAQSFMSTKEFAALVAAAGDPQSCQALRGWSPPANPGITGLQRLYACLSAVAPQ